MRSNWGNKAAVEVWLSARPTRNPILETMRDSFDGGDPWGSTMEWWFAIADYTTDTYGDTPAEWEFRQSPCGSNEDAYAFQQLDDLRPSEAQLLHAGNVLSRYAAQLKLAEMDY